MKRDELRYKPRHTWYLADAQLLVRELQAACWPLFHHVALGGGVLNHGYSDKDVDIYVLPNYKPGVVHANIEESLVTAISFAIGSAPLLDMKAKSDVPEEGDTTFVTADTLDWVDGGCFAHSLRYEDAEGRTIDVFIVRALPATAEAPAEGRGADKDDVSPSSEDIETVARFLGELGEGLYGASGPLRARAIEMVDKLGYEA